MTHLEKLNIPVKKEKQLMKAGIGCIEDILSFYPRCYTDRTKLTGIRENEESVFLFRCQTVNFNSGRVNVIEARGVLEGTNTQIYIKWFNQHFLYSDICATKDKVVLVAGMVKWMPADFTFRKPARYELVAPALYDESGIAALGIYPTYKKIPGMAEDYFKTIVAKAFFLMGHQEETLPQEIISGSGLMPHDQMVQTLHHPKNQEMLNKALERKRWDDLLYFALRIEMSSRGISNGSIYGLPSLAQMNKVRDSLPFTLTQGQQDTLTAAIDHIRTGRRLNALLQGDVGCGKTIVAQLLMIAFAGNGYQAAMMAPTQILAKQHYDDLVRLCEPLGISVAYVGGGTLRKAEQRALEEGIASGATQLIVGTQALLSANYSFKNLALVVEDEEHKYGVIQRKALTEKAAGGTHTLTMSATPIPRSLAQTIYGDRLQLYSINEKPAGRKPVATGIAPDCTKAIAFLKKSCKLGQQAYVVCPMVAPNEKVAGVATAEETLTLYRSELKPLGISVALVTGRTPKKEAVEILKQFSEGSISVLVSTTIIEVGVNVPNANCIIIHNAERFGLAQLHQLRGRVGRGSSNAFCALISADGSNERLQAMVMSNDGFKIAEMDLQQRGAGDFLGTQQSGTEKYLAMALQHPAEYKAAQTAAKAIIDGGKRCLHLELAEKDHAQQKGGEFDSER